jgi:sulfatase maturation enzyme AslB (radical SAM superfamily)
MICPRLKHFVRLQPSGKVSKCGHMVNAREFDTFNDMQDSKWLADINAQMEKNIWPAECIRCQTTENINNRSIRLDMIERDKILKAINTEYLVVGGVLDNICNSACQTCNENLSSKIGSLKKNSVRVDNYKKFYELPTERIVELDINGGEPTYSPNYKKILKELPANVRIVRINTNAHQTFDSIVTLLERGVRIIITVSFDGLNDIHDYVRWPIKFTNVENTIKDYKNIQKLYPTLLKLNLWTTVSVYNINQFENIVKYTKEHELEHSFGLLESPNVLSVAHCNKLTVDAKLKYIDSKDSTLKSLAKKIAIQNNNSPLLKDYIEQQDRFRSIRFEDYFNFDPNTL